MVKALITSVLFITGMVGIAAAGAIEELEARGIDRGSIEKVRMSIYEDVRYKGIDAAIHYCDSVATKKELEKAIATTKRMKGRSGAPSYSTLERLDDSYATNAMEIKEQKKLYKAAFNKGLTVGTCKNAERLAAQLDTYHDQLLNKAFADKRL